MHLRCMTEYVNLSPYLITFGDGLRLHHASAMHDRIRSEKPNASFAVAWFLLLLFPAHTRKSCRLRVSRTSCVLIFSLYVRRNQMPASLSLGFFPHYSILRGKQTYDRKKRTSQSMTAKSFVLALFDFAIGYSVSFSCGC